MFEDGAKFLEFLFYSHTCMLSILNNFCIITICVDFKSQCYFQYHTTKKLINIRGYSLIHINEMINLKSMRLFISIKPLVCNNSTLYTISSIILYNIV